MVDVQARTDDAGVTVTISGGLLFDEIAPIVDAMRSVLTAPAVTVDLSGVERFDLCGVQALYSFSAAAAAAQLPVSWELGQMADRLSRMAEFAGLPAIGQHG